jgi:hypothetical protein
MNKECIVHYLLFLIIKIVSLKIIKLLHYVKDIWKNIN